MESRIGGDTPDLAEKKQRTKKVEEGGNLGESFHSFSREREYEMESERKREMGEGKESGCV